MTPEARMTALALSFPTLRDAPVDPWDAEAVEAWIRGGTGGSGARHAARFVLGVWSSRRYAVDANDLRTALGVPAERDGFAAAPIAATEWSPPARDFLIDGYAFDVLAALAVWDARHRDAFLAWARAPWWA